ncbi:MAG: hypothetical protein JNK46_07990, partial [Methylobacteriaceae bacterium]|nr:hypothetical protein [Methylobacteriaceae bacterium]
MSTIRKTGGPAPRLFGALLALGLLAAPQALAQSQPAAAAAAAPRAAKAASQATK